MQKIEIEWQENPQTWRTATVEYRFTKKDNMSFKFKGKLHVVWNLKEGQKVLQLIENEEDREKSGWIVVGRVSHGRIFIGEGMSYAEYCETPEGKKQVQQFLQDLRKGW